jgi:hypothetical protein
MIRRVRLGLAALSLLVIGIVAWRSVPPPVRPPLPKQPPYCALVIGESAAKGCRYDTGITDQSPSIQVSRGGVLFIGRNSAGVLRSMDKGLTWQAITPPVHANGDNHAKGVHGTVHIDPVTDRVWYVTGNSAASCGAMKGGAVVSWSDDLGATWKGSTTGCGTYDWGRMITGFHPAGLQQRAVYFFGVAPRLVGGLRPVYRSLDGGASWTQMKNPASVTTESGAGIAAPDGTLYFDYPEYIGFDPHRIVDQTYPFKPANLCRQMIAVSEDFGETWRQEPIPNSQGCRMLTGQQRVAVDKVGTVYVLWTDDRDSQVYLVTSRDKARTWSAPVKVTPVGATFNNANANIVAGEPGHVVIASLNTQAKNNPRRWLFSGFGVWHAWLSESFDANSATPHFRVVDLDPSGDPTLAEGESPSEAEAYLGMSPTGEAWAAFSRHGGRLGKGSRFSAARLHP